jgi:5-methyltetrahydrofolate--homocysteine methyltransferase
MGEDMTNRFMARLAGGEVLVADGATGTNLQKAGLQPGAAPEDWVFDQPDKLLALHGAWVAAGSDIILSCTFGGTRLRLKDSRYVERTAELNRRAVELAREAARARPDVLIAGSMGPTGQLFEPFGMLSHKAAVAAYAEQAQALTEGGADLLVLETHFALDEAGAAIEGAREGSDLPIVISFSFDRGVRTMMGVGPADVVETFQSSGVVAVGANCGTTLDNMEQIVREFAATESNLIIWAKPNAGLPVVQNGVATYQVSPEQMAAAAVRNVQSGARVVGGCCGSMPAHLAAISSGVKALRI